MQRRRTVGAHIFTARSERRDNGRFGSTVCVEPADPSLKTTRAIFFVPTFDSESDAIEYAFLEATRRVSARADAL